jgi:hypothetical protein
MTTFPTASRARLRHASTGPQTAQGRELETRNAGDGMREMRRVHDHQGQGLSGMSGEGPRRGVGRCRALSRGGRCRARRADAGRPFRFPQAGGCSPSRESSAPRQPISAGGPSNGAGDYFAVKVCRLGCSCWSHERRTNRAALDCAPPRQTHWHLSGWTGQSGGRADSRPYSPRSVGVRIDQYADGGHAHGGHAYRAPHWWDERPDRGSPRTACGLHPHGWHSLDMAQRMAASRRRPG